MMRNQWDIFFFWKVWSTRLITAVFEGNLWGRDISPCSLDWQSGPGLGHQLPAPGPAPQWAESSQIPLCLMGTVSGLQGVGWNPGAWAILQAGGSQPIHLLLGHHQQEVGGGSGGIWQFCVWYRQELLLGYKMSLRLSLDAGVPGERCSLAVTRKQIARSSL